MTDHYSPSDHRRSGHYQAEERYGSLYERGSRLRRNDRSPTRRHERSRSRSPGRRYEADRQHYDYRPSSNDFHFRGAAENFGPDRKKSHDRSQARNAPHHQFNLPRPENRSFTFRYSPPTNRANVPSGPRRSRSASPRHNRPRPRGRSTVRAGRHSSHGRARLGGRSEHDRKLLHANGGRTPEQLPGMTAEGEVRFRAPDLSEDEKSDDGRDAASSQCFEDDESDHPRHKRAKTGLNDPVKDIEVPKWATAEPVLMGEDGKESTKKDLAKLIRAARIDSEANNGFADVAQTDDFMSFKTVPAASEDGEASEIHSYPPPSKSRLGSLGTSKEGPRQNRQPDVNYSTGYDMIMPSNEELFAKYDGTSRRGKKRKREESDIKPEWMSDGSDPSPWHTVDHSKADEPGSLSRLHHEICAFYDFVRPLEHENEVRLDLVSRINNAVQTHSFGGPDVKVLSFGSFASGMYLPTADMDLVAVSKTYMNGGDKIAYQSKKELFKLLGYLQRKDVASYAGSSVIPGAKVPIVKFVDEKTGIRVDISFENDTGLVAIKTFEAWRAEHPPLQPLVALVKQLLAMRGLNEVMHGGLGGFSIICLVVSMLELSESSETQGPGEDLGELFLKFLDLYGNNFNTARTGIRMRPAGYFDKIKNPAKSQNNKKLTILDPNKIDNDISGGSHNIQNVFECFRDSHAAIQHRLSDIEDGQDVKGSILECVLGGNYSSFSDQRAKLATVYEESGLGSSHELPPQKSKQKSTNGRADFQRYSPEPEDIEAEVQLTAEQRREQGSNTFGLSGRFHPGAAELQHSEQTESGPQSRTSERSHSGNRQRSFQDAWTIRKQQFEQSEPAITSTSPLLSDYTSSDDDSASTFADRMMIDSSPHRTIDSDFSPRLIHATRNIDLAAMGFTRQMEFSGEDRNSDYEAHVLGASPLRTDRLRRNFSPPTDAQVAATLASLPPSRTCNPEDSMDLNQLDVRVRAGLISCFRELERVSGAALDVRGEYCADKSTVLAGRPPVYVLVQATTQKILTQAMGLLENMKQRWTD